MSWLALVAGLAVLALYICFEIGRVMRNMLLACPQCDGTMTKKGRELTCRGCGLVVTIEGRGHVD